MPCAELDELISAYADGETAPAQTEFLRMHLETCARCTAVLRRYKETRRLLTFASDDAWTPPDLRLRVTHAYLQQSRPARRAGTLGPLAACMAALVLILGVLFGHGALTHTASVRPSPPVARLAQSTLCGACSTVPTVRYATVQGRKVPLSLLREVAYDLDSHVPMSEITALSLPAGWPDETPSSSTAPAKGGEVNRAQNRRPHALPS